MSDKSKIEWTDATWSPVVGCTKIAAGCKNCYAERMAIRLAAMERSQYTGQYYDSVTSLEGWNGKIALIPERLEIPLHWKKPRRIFVCSMSDLFHKKVPFEFIDRVAMIITLAPQHTYQILTKRPERALACYNRWINKSDTNNLFQSNVWPGISISTQEDIWMVEKLIQIPAAVRFISIEPLLEDINPIHNLSYYLGDGLIHQVIVGAESGPKRRPCEIKWVRDIVEQCKAAGVKIFIKQLSINGKVEHDMAKFPKDLQIRNYPR